MQRVILSRADGEGSPSGTEDPSPSARLRMTTAPQWSDLSAPFECLRHRHLIGVFEVAADGKAEREPRGAHLERLELLRDVERRRFPLDVGVGGDDHLAYAAR